MIFEAWPWASTRLHLAGFMWRSCHSHIGAGAQLLNHSSLEGASVTAWGPPVKLLRTLAFLIPGTSLKSYLSGVLNEAIFPSSELVISTSSSSPSSSPLPRPPCPQNQESTVGAPSCGHNSTHLCCIHLTFTQCHSVEKNDWHNFWSLDWIVIISEQKHKCYHQSDLLS